MRLQILPESTDTRLVIDPDYLTDATSEAVHLTRISRMSIRM